MRTDELDFDLPAQQIAQQPCVPRDASRLLVLDRAAQSWTEDRYCNVASHLCRGDCLVLNDTKVIPARLFGAKPTGGRVEIFLLKEEAPGTWAALLRPSAKAPPGTRILLAGGVEAVAHERLAEGKRRVTFNRPDVLAWLQDAGIVPLPPYIQRREECPADAHHYQTVYAEKPGAVAAPTAGLHLTPRVFQRLAARDIATARLTLHVGYGTFKPITSDTLDAHRVDSEWFDFPAGAAAQLNAVRAAGGRIVAVGTTAARVLETQWHGGAFQPGAGMTDHYIHPPYDFGGVDVLQTNFHLPRSSLLALVCAFAGAQFVLEAYRYARDAGFRFYSYGDAMLIT